MDENFKRLQKVYLFSTIFPFILVLIAWFMKKNGFENLVSEYDKGIARIVQYILFFIGAFIFFFCEGVGDFIAKRIFYFENKKSKIEEKENILSYFTYTVIMVWLLNLITITGFIGFLICGNISWLVVFLLLNISMIPKYYPTKSRLEHLLTKISGK